MKGKVAFVLGAAVGYVLGTRAGRERYEQIKRGAQRLWQTAPVQRGVNAVRDRVDEQAEELKQLARKTGAQLLGKLSEQAAGTSKHKGSSGAKSGKPDAGAADASLSAPQGTESPRAAEAPQSADAQGSAGEQGTA